MTAASREPLSKMETIIKNDRVRVGDSSGETPPALPAGSPDGSNRNGARCKKSVQLLREKDVVHAIEVRCSCGEITVVEISYGSITGQES
ncbi:MAG TPA: hypothetical protein VM509_10275 [Planctomycetota bacterium]|nr:hypothetical protein [Planctomycetota bacterium]